MRYSAWLSYTTPQLMLIKAACRDQVAPQHQVRFDGQPPHTGVSPLAADLEGGGPGRERRLAAPVVAVRPCQRDAARRVPVAERGTRAHYSQVLAKWDRPAAD